MSPFWSTVGLIVVVALIIMIILVWWLILFNMAMEKVEVVFRRLVDFFLTRKKQLISELEEELGEEGIDTVVNKKARSN